MSEQLSKGLSQEDNQVAKNLFNRHRSNAESLTASVDTKKRADVARKIVEAAWSDGTFEDVPYETRVFANGESTQRQMVDQAQLFYDANLWRAREHKEQHLEEYIEQAKQEAKDSGVDIKE